MGQYYMPIVTTGKKQKTEVFYSHDYDCGLKMTEHAWVGNPMVYAVTMRLLNHPCRVAWMGDYSDVCDRMDKAHNYRPIYYSRDNADFEELQWTFDYDGAKTKTVKQVITEMGGGYFTDTKEYMRYYNIAHKHYDEYPVTMQGIAKIFEGTTKLHYKVQHLKWQGKDCKEDERELKRQEIYQINFNEMIYQSHKMLMILNHTKKQYIDMGHYMLNNEYTAYGYPHCMHPIPLLTACGNGTGSGDYSGVNEHLCGYWAFDKLEVKFGHDARKYHLIYHDVDFMFRDDI